MSFSDIYENEKGPRALQCFCLQCFDAVGLASGRAFGL